MSDFSGFASGHGGRARWGPVVGVCATCKKEVRERATRLYKAGMDVRIHTRDDGIVMTGKREFDPVAFGINQGDDESP